jgi:response regulator RpfG family c-di-GMP phosphodiesterase
MSLPIELEFVLVSSDYATVQTVSTGVKKYGGKFSLVPDAEAARDYLNRRKIDGVFVDMETPGAIALIESIRKGASNSKVVIFACGTSSREHTSTLTAGANFLLRKPLSVDNVVLHINISKELLERERRRYFRHSVNLSVLLKEGTTEQRARMTNVSEGGMAVRTVKPLNKGAMVEVTFALPLGMNLKGKGQVAWINTEGVAGITMQAFEGKGKEYLEAWLTAQEEIERKRKTPEN